MNSETMWFNGVKITASAGYRKVAFRILRYVAALLCIGGGVRWGLGYSPTLDVAVGRFFDVLGILVALTVVGVVVYNVVDFVVSRRERRKYYRLTGRTSTGRRRLEAVPQRIIAPRYVVLTEEMMTRGDQALEPEPVDLDQLSTKARP